MEKRDLLACNCDLCNSGTHDPKKLMCTYAGSTESVLVGMVRFNLCPYCKRSKSQRSAPIALLRRRTG